VGEGGKEGSRGEEGRGRDGLVVSDLKREEGKREGSQREETREARHVINSRCTRTHSTTRSSCTFPAILLPQKRSARLIKKTTNDASVLFVSRRLPPIPFSRLRRLTNEMPSKRVQASSHETAHEKVDERVPRSTSFDESRVERDDDKVVESVVASEGSLGTDETWSEGVEEDLEDAAKVKKPREEG